MLNVTVIGLGYVGLVTSAGLAEWGHGVTGIDASRERLDALKEGRMPFYEPGLSDLVERNQSANRLRFLGSEESIAACSEADLVIIAVGTHDGNGGWQTDTIRSALSTVVPAMSDDGVLVVRSTLPPDFVTQLPDVVRQLRRSAGRAAIPTLLNPEFTREASAVKDFMHPDRIIIGTADDPEQIGVERMRDLYAQAEAPFLVLGGVDAAISKLGANLFLATKISFANELAVLCDRFGARIDQVVSTMAYDARIGGSFLRAGVGFGGSCLPHQVSETVRSAAAHGMELPLFEAVETINARQRHDFVDRLAEAAGGLEGKRVALLGLTFKPNTDDLRDAPSLTIASRLLEEGAQVIAFDPMRVAAERAADIVQGLQLARTVEEALTDADVIGLVTEWPEFSDIDWSAARGLVNHPAVVDGRNALSPERVVQGGFSYTGFGRGSMVGHEDEELERTIMATSTDQRTYPTAPPQQLFDVVGHPTLGERQTRSA